MKDIEGTAYTLIAYSKALRCKVRLVIWQMPNGKKELFFSTDTSSLIISLSKTLRTIMRTVCSSCTMTKLTWNHSFTLASCTYLLIFLCPIWWSWLSRPRRNRSIGRILLWRITALRRRQTARLTTRRCDITSQWKQITSTILHFKFSGLIIKSQSQREINNLS